MDKAVVLVSGGVNSAVLAAAAREEYECHLLHVAWGHRAAERELLAFEQLAAHFRTDKTMVAELSCLAAFGGNSRSSKRVQMEEVLTLGQDTPSTFVLGLMPCILSLAASWASSLGAKRILVGTSEDHDIPGPVISHIYPDYRRDFVQVFNLMLEYAKPSGLELMVEVPLAELTRQEVVSLGRKLKVPFDKTWSCYRSNEEPCGKCLGCASRAGGFLRACCPDPLLLEPAHRA